MAKRGNTGQDDLFVSQKRLPLPPTGSLLAFDAWEGSLRVLQGGAGQKSSPSERQKDFAAAEVERLNLDAVYATDESWEKLGPFEEAGLNVSTLPRPLAVYWSFRSQVGDEPCLVISTGKERTRCSLVMGGELLAEGADGKALSLNGIWNSHLSLPANGPTKMVYEARRLRDETFEGEVFDGFLSALRAGKAANISGFPISSPIHLDGSLEAFRALAARTVAASPVPGLRVRKVILSDWAAAHCNLRELLGADYTVLSDAPRAAFYQAVRGLMLYAIAQTAEPRPALPQPLKRPPAVQPTPAPRPAEAPPAAPHHRDTNPAERPVHLVGVAEPEVVAAPADAAARTRQDLPVEAAPADAARPKAVAGRPSPESPAGSPPTPATPDAQLPQPTHAPLWRLLVVVAILLLVGIFFWAMIPNSSGSNDNGTPTPQPTAEGQGRPAANSGMVLIAGGDFMMGRNDGDGLLEQPAHRVTVSPFLIDAREVTCDEYALFVAEKNWATPKGWQGGRCPEGTGQHPVSGVTWDDANAYVGWRSQREGVKYRLPTEEEWEFAARGTQGRLYPWGNAWRDGVANIGRSARGGPVNVGSFVEGSTREGVHDLIGNVWEWTSSELKPYPGGSLPQMQPGDFKVMRGGSWNSGDDITATYRAYWYARGDYDYSKTGFRCARTAP